MRWIRFTRRTAILALAAAMLAAGVPGARAGAQLQFFFPVGNDPFNALDDEVLVRSIHWGEDPLLQEWVLFVSPFTSRALLQFFPINGTIENNDIRLAIIDGLQEWNDSSISSFQWEDDVFFSHGPLSGLVDTTLNPLPTGAAFDGHNLITFQDLNVQLETGVLAVASVFFLEHEFDYSESVGIPIGDIEGSVIIPVDLNLDGLIDVNLLPKDYAQGELIEADIIFNSELSEFWVNWPDDPDEIPAHLLPFVPDSFDIQAIVTHELGHALGAGHSTLAASSMFNFNGLPLFPGNPYEQRTLSYDDHLAAASIYPNGIGNGKGAIKGWILDGQSFVGAVEDEDGGDPDPNEIPQIPFALAHPLEASKAPEAMAKRDWVRTYVLQAQVLLGVPAPPGFHPDNISTSEGEMRLVGQTFSGQNLQFPWNEVTAGGGADLLIEPILTNQPPIDWLQAQVGEDLNGNGILDQGEDRNANFQLDGTTIVADSIYLFPGLEPRGDYVVLIDQSRTVGGEEGGFAATNNVIDWLAATETFVPEFYGGALPNLAGVLDSFEEVDLTEQDPNPVLATGLIEFVSVSAGNITDDITIITNVSDGEDDLIDEELGTPRTFGFLPTDGAIPESDYAAVSGDIGDLNGDGYADFVVAVLYGTSDPSDLVNRVFLSVPSPVDPRRRVFEDITFGDDTVAGTPDDIMPMHLDNSRDVKLGDFNGDGRLDLFVSNAGNIENPIASSQGVFDLGGYNRLYLNEADASVSAGFRFRDVSATVLPGFLNRGWGPTDASGGTNIEGMDNSTRAAVGDIDGDGDLDLIVSMLFGRHDGYPRFGTCFELPDTCLINPIGCTPLPDQIIPTGAMIDVAPNMLGTAAYDGDFVFNGEFDGQDVMDDLLTASSNATGNIRVQLRGDEDLNCNGVLDINEDIGILLLDGNPPIYGPPAWIGNGMIDTEDLDMDGILDPDEDVNMNGILDPGEDLNMNGILDPSEDLNMNGVIDTEDVNGDGLLDLIDEDVNGNGILDDAIFGGPLVFNERVLINRSGEGAEGFRFVDESLGADNRFGGAESLLDRSLNFFEFGHVFFNANTDRIPPLFPVTVQLTTAGPNFISSPMGQRAFEPRLGPFYHDSSLDLMSVRAFRDSGSSTDGAINDSQSVFYQNLDATGDGIADGYFATVNYGLDFLWRSGSGLFPYRDSILEVSPNIPVPVLFNPGFENLAMVGWTIVDNPSPFFALGSSPAGVSLAPGFFATAPTQGTRVALTGWEGAVPGDITLTSNPSAGLTAEYPGTMLFDYRAAWDQTSATEDKEFRVTVRPANPLTPIPPVTMTVLTAPAGSLQNDTGNQTVTLNIASLIDVLLEIEFEWTVPEGGGGPAQFQLDNIRFEPLQDIPVRRIEPIPLLIGIPDGVPGDIENFRDFTDADSFEPILKGAFTGAIADWEYRGSPKPIIAPDTDFEPDPGFGFVYSSLGYSGFDSLEGRRIYIDGFFGGGSSGFFFTDRGSSRGAPRISDDAGADLLTGIGMTFFTQENNILLSSPAHIEAGLWPRGEEQLITGEAHGIAVSDLDNDGDPDVVLGETVINGYVSSTDGVLAIIIADTPAANQLFLNNSYGRLYDRSMLMPDGRPLLDANFRDAKITYQPLAGDLENDGDQDLIMINTLAGHDMLTNSLYDPAAPPNLESEIDLPLFTDKTPEFLPPVYGASIEPPFGSRDLAGISVRAAVADLTNNGLPDLITAEGGLVSTGDFMRVDLNHGPRRAEPGRPFNDAAQYYAPLGTAHPGPRIRPPVDPFIFPFLFIGGCEAIAELVPLLPPGELDMILADCAEAGSFGSSSFQYVPYAALNGFLGDDRSPFTDVLALDFSGDGSADIITARSGKGPGGYLNTDSLIGFLIENASVVLSPTGGGFVPPPESFYNSRPDGDLVPDGVLINLAGIGESLGSPTILMPELTDPCPTVGVSLKKFNRALGAADFDGNGSLDLVLANGLASSGAPNALLLNFPVSIFPVPDPLPRFVDVTETHLPTVPGSCGLPVGIPDDTYDAATADFDHDGDIDIIFANRSSLDLNFDGLSDDGRAGFRFLRNLTFDATDGGQPGVFADSNDTFGNLPAENFYGKSVWSIVVADFDGAGEWTEDLNGNGVLDSGEDTNGNGVLDVSEDTNGNGVLDPGEDRNGNGLLDLIDLPDERTAGDLNGDGVITARTDGIWEPSFDLYITFRNESDALLLQLPDNSLPGIFFDASDSHLPDPLDGIIGTPLFVDVSKITSAGARAGDIDNDGDLDLVVARGIFTNTDLIGVTAAGDFLPSPPPVRVLLNDGSGSFRDASHEVPAPRSTRVFAPAPNPDAEFISSNGLIYGTAMDVELLDVDLDGDLDIFVANAGEIGSISPIGGLNLLYQNRLNGANFNQGALTLASAVSASSLLASPLITRLTPDSAPAGVTLDVVIEGANFDTGARISFGADVIVNSVRVLDSRRAVANVTIPADAPTGVTMVELANNAPALTGGPAEASAPFEITLQKENAVRSDRWDLYE